MKIYEKFIVLCMIWTLSFWFLMWFYDNAYNHKYGRWNVTSKELRKEMKKFDLLIKCIPIVNTFVAIALFIWYGLPYKTPKTND